MLNLEVRFGYINNLTNTRQHEPTTDLISCVNEKQKVLCYRKTSAMYPSFIWIGFGAQATSTKKIAQLWKQVFIVLRFEDLN